MNQTTATWGAYCTSDVILTVEAAYMHHIMLSWWSFLIWNVLSSVLGGLTALASWLCVCEYICCNFWRHSNTVPSPRHMPSAVLADEINVETRVGRMTGVRVCLKSTHLCISATNLFKVSVSVALSIMQLLAQSYSWVIALCAIKYATVSQSCLSVPSQFSHALSAPRIDSRRDADEIREYCSDSFAHEFFNRALLMGGQTVVELEIWIVKACWGPGLPILLKKSLLLRSVLIYRHDFVGT